MLRAIASVLGVGLGLGGAVVARAEPTAASPPPAEIELEWDAPASCPTSAAILARVEALLTMDPRGEGTVRVQGRVGFDGARHRLRLTTNFRGRVEQRELEAAACEELGEATAIVLAVALEPGLDAAFEPMPPVVPAEPAAVVPPPAESAAVSSRAPSVAVDEPAPPDFDRVRPSPAEPTPRLARRARPEGWHMGLGAAVEAGALPGVSGGPRLAFGLRWPAMRLELHGSYLAPRLRTSATGVGGRYQTGMMGLRACGRVRAATFEVPLCAGVEAGVVRAATRGVDPPRVRHGPWLGPLLSVGVARRLGERAGLWATLEGVGRAYGSAFTFAGDVRFQQFPVSGRVLVGAELFLP